METVDSTYDSVLPEGDEENPVTLMGGSDGSSWYKHRLDIISRTVKVLTDPADGVPLPELELSYLVTLVEQRGLALHLNWLTMGFDHRCDSSNVLTDDDSGSNLVDDFKEIWPQVPVVVGAPALSRA